MQEMQEDAKPEYLTVAEVMRFLGISRRTVERYIKDERVKPGYLPSGQRRFLRSDVEALVSSTPPVKDQH